MAESSPSGPGVSVEAVVPEFPVSRFHLSGWTSPNAQVKLSMDTLSQKTQADIDGFFSFAAVESVKTAKEVCLQAYDRNNRAIPTLCLPVPPRVDETTEVGPVLLAPTMEKSTHSLQSMTIGESIPNAVVKVKVVTTSESSLSLIPEAYAIYLFTYEVNVDQNGYFAFTLPSVKNRQFRFIAQTQYKNSLSPPSATLTFGELAKSASNTVIILIFVVLVFFTVISCVILFKFYQRKKAKEKIIPASNVSDKIV